MNFIFSAEESPLREKAASSTLLLLGRGTLQSGCSVPRRALSQLIGWGTEGQELGPGSRTGVRGRSRQALGKWWERSCLPGTQGLCSLFLILGLKVFPNTQGGLTHNSTLCLTSVTCPAPCSLCPGHFGLLPALQHTKHILFSGLLHELLSLSRLPFLQPLLCFAWSLCINLGTNVSLPGLTHLKLHPTPSIPLFYVFYLFLSLYFASFFKSTSYIPT